jgi:hypothetical protein
VTNRPQIAHPATLIVHSIDIFTKINALKAVLLSLPMLGQSAKNAMQSVALAKTAPRHVFHATHHLRKSSSLALIAWRTVLRVPQLIIKD